MLLWSSSFAIKQPHVKNIAKLPVIKDNDGLFMTTWKTNVTFAWLITCYLFPPVCLLVGRSVGLSVSRITQKLLNRFPETWREDGTRPRSDPAWILMEKKKIKKTGVFWWLLSLSEHNSVQTQITVGPWQSFSSCDLLNEIRLYRVISSWRMDGWICDGSPG